MAFYVPIESNSNAISIFGLENFRRLFIQTAKMKPQLTTVSAKHAELFFSSLSSLTQYPESFGIPSTVESFCRWVVEFELFPNEHNTINICRAAEVPEKGARLLGCMYRI